MFTDVYEVVEVSAIFKKNKAVPVALHWNSRVYKITKINMVHQVFDGDTRIHYFAVSDESNYFKLAFNTKTLKWNLEQVYHEG